MTVFVLNQLDAMIYSIILLECNLICIGWKQYQR